MAAAAFGSWDLGIGGKSERYVIHIRASKSSRKAEGQPPSSLASLITDDSSGSSTTLSSLILLPTTSSETSERDIRLGDWDAWLDVEE